MVLSASLLRRSFAPRRATAVYTPARFSSRIFGPLSIPREFGRVPAPLWLLPSVSAQSTVPAAFSSSPKSPLEACDCNHWHILMKFPHSKLSYKEMVNAFVETCAKGLGCSVENAIKKICTFSRTHYVGFKALMMEKESENIPDIPGVAFILRDAYGDSEKHQYGGDDYDNRTLKPKSPPIMYYLGVISGNRPLGYSTTPQHKYGMARKFGPPSQNDSRGHGRHDRNDGRFSLLGQNNGRGFGLPSQHDCRGYGWHSKFGPPGQIDARRFGLRSLIDRGYSTMHNVPEDPLVFVGQNSDINYFLDRDYPTVHDALDDSLVFIGQNSGNCSLDEDYGQCGQDHSPRGADCSQEVPAYNQTNATCGLGEEEFVGGYTQNGPLEWWQKRWKP